MAAGGGEWRQKQLSLDGSHHLTVVAVFPFWFPIKQLQPTREESTRFQSPSQATTHLDHLGGGTRQSKKGTTKDDLLISYNNGIMD